MVACGSRVGLRRYCPLLGEAGMTLTEDDAWQQYWLFAAYSCGGNVDGGHGLEVAAAAHRLGWRVRCAQPAPVGLACPVPPAIVDVGSGSTGSRNRRWENRSPTR